MLNTRVFGGGRGGTGKVLSLQYLGNPLPVIIPKVAAVLTALDTVLFNLYKNWPFTAIEFLIQYIKLLSKIVVIIGYGILISKFTSVCKFCQFLLLEIE